MAAAVDARGPGPRLILWDIDGTLIDADAFDVFLEHRALLEVFGLTDVDLSDHHGRTHDQIALDLAAACGIPRTEAGPLVVKFREVLEKTFIDRQEEYLRSVRVLPGAREAIRRIRAAGHRQTVLTGNTQGCARRKLEPLGMLDDLDLRIGAFGDDHHDRAALGQVLLDRVHIALGSRPDPTNLIVIGESPRDIACARANGFGVVAVASGVYDVAELARHQPDVLIEDLRDADGILDALASFPVPQPSSPI